MVRLSIDLSSYLPKTKDNIGQGTVPCPYRMPEYSGWQYADSNVRV